MSTVEPGEIVIVACGKRKRSTATPAHALYTGGFFATTIAWAEAKATPECIFILSALYGLVGYAQVIAPYEKRLGEPGSTTAAVVRRQAVDFGIVMRPAVVLGGQDYVTLVRSAWAARVRAPFGVEGGHKNFVRMMRAMRDSLASS